MELGKASVTLWSPCSYFSFLDIAWGSHLGCLPLNLLVWLYLLSMYNQLGLLTSLHQPFLQATTYAITGQGLWAAVEVSLCRLGCPWAIWGPLHLPHRPYGLQISGVLRECTWDQKEKPHAKMVLWQAANTHWISQSLCLGNSVCKSTS